jgi:uncharacterized integral membrane protein (TIGR00698 family)
VVSGLLSTLLGEALLGFDKSPVSPVMLAIVSGMWIRNRFALSSSVLVGVQFAMKRLLIVGIVLLGSQLSVRDIWSIGVVGLPIVAGCILGAIGCTALLSSLLKLPSKLAALIAVGTSICGVTAIVATGPAIQAKKEEIAYAVSVITIFGLFSTVAYPYLAHWLFQGEATQVGLFLGTAVHDTAQVTGAALLFADVFGKPEALNTAVVTKLVRNLSMVLLIPAISYAFARQDAALRVDAAGTGSSWRERTLRFVPTFLLWFLGLALVRSLGDTSLAWWGTVFGILSEQTWQAGLMHLKSVAGWLMVIALAGVGLNTDVHALRRLGWKPLGIGFVAATTVGILSYSLIQWLVGSPS